MCEIDRPWLLTVTGRINQNTQSLSYSALLWGEKTIKVKVTKYIIRLKFGLQFINKFDIACTKKQFGKSKEFKNIINVS